MEGVRHLTSLVGHSEISHNVHGTVMVGLRVGIERIISETGIRCYVGDELNSSNSAFSTILICSVVSLTDETGRRSA